MKLYRPVVDCAWAGKPPLKSRSAIETIRFTIYDFQHQQDKIESRNLMARNHRWIITVAPPDSNSKSVVSCVGYPHPAGPSNVTAVLTSFCKGVVTKSPIPDHLSSNKSSSYSYYVI
mmetsp:Transcript_417/g.952  ORF Transcript_417/g.952 Transcript_417/m.952 type:complete len:117 (+) Transcript_417:450-800(+)